MEFKNLISYAKEKVSELKINNTMLVRVNKLRSWKVKKNPILKCYIKNYLKTQLNLDLMRYGLTYAEHNSKNIIMQWLWHTMWFS
jgi:hypothetical protein